MRYERDINHLYTTTCQKTAESIQWWMNVYECEETLKDGYGCDIVIYIVDSKFKAQLDGYDVMHGDGCATIIEVG
jgi:hypothetical protein